MGSSAGAFPWMLIGPVVVLGRNATGETQYRYFGPGTYTVVLEAWSGDFYIAVTITC